MNRQQVLALIQHSIWYLQFGSDPKDREPDADDLAAIKILQSIKDQLSKE